MKKNGTPRRALRSLNGVLNAEKRDGRRRKMFEIRAENVNQISVSGDKYETVIKLFNCVGTPLRIVLQADTAEALSDNLEAYFRLKKQREQRKIEQDRYEEYLAKVKELKCSDLALSFEDWKQIKALQESLKGGVPHWI